MPTLLPQDSNNNPIPAMRYVDGAAHVIAAGGVATRNASAFNADTRIISLYADVPVYMAFGDAAILATSADHYFPAGFYYDIAIGGDASAQATHVSVLAVGASGSVYVSERE